MLIFDRFPTRGDAEEFAATQSEAVVCDSQEESDKIDIFPFVLEAPIVLVPRSEADDPEIANRQEALVIKAADIFGGAFAGT